MLSEKNYLDRERELLFLNYTTTMEQLKSINMFHPPHELKGLIIDKRIEMVSTSCYDQNNLLSLSSTTSSSIIKQARVNIPKRKQTRILNPSVISLVMILYLLPNLSIMNFSNTKGKPNNTIEQRTNFINQKERSLFGLVGASPAPEPAASIAKTSSSGTHRIPPMNGSIFGKRSLEKHIQHSESIEPFINNDNKKDYGSNENKSYSRFDASTTITTTTTTTTTTNNQQQQQQVPPKSDEYKRGESENKQTIKYKIERPYSTLRSNQIAKSVPINYKDIITEIIEDFLASNNESDPEETSLAFCRMIVYECTKMLSARNGSGPKGGTARRLRNRIRGKDRSF